MATARAKLADEPETLAKFDELYEAARYSFPLTEDHAFYIDQLFISVFRRFALAVGERLVAKGVVDQPDDVFFLYRDEVVDALGDGGDQRADGRRAAGQHGRGQSRSRRRPRSAPRHRPPRYPTRSWTRSVYRLLGMVPPEENADPGRAQGRRRLTRRLHRDGQGGAVARRGDRPRGRRGHGLRDDAAALGAGVLDRRRDRRRRRRRAVATAPSWPASSASRPWSARRSARRPSRPARPSPSTAPRASSTSTAAARRRRRRPRRRGSDVRGWRILLASSSVCLNGIWVLVGAFYVATKYRRVGPRPVRTASSASTGRQLRLGAARTFRRCHGSSGSLRRPRFCPRGCSCLVPHPRTRAHRHALGDLRRLARRPPGARDRDQLPRSMIPVRGDRDVRGVRVRPSRRYIDNPNAEHWFTKALTDVPQG